MAQSNWQSSKESLQSMRSNQATHHASSKIWQMSLLQSWHVTKNPGKHLSVHLHCQMSCDCSVSHNGPLSHLGGHVCDPWWETKGSLWQIHPCKSTSQTTWGAIGSCCKHMCCREQWSSSLVVSHQSDHSIHSRHVPVLHNDCLYPWLGQNWDLKQLLLLHCQNTKTIPFHQQINTSTLTCNQMSFLERVSVRNAEVKKHEVDPHHHHVTTRAQ